MTLRLLRRFQLKKIWVENRGVSAVEFALIATPLFVLIFGTLQNLLLSTARITLDNALQSLAYDAANADSNTLSTILTRENLCQKSALFLIDCLSDPDLCFSANPIDITSEINPSKGKCSSKAMPIMGSRCCYQITVQYPVPLVFDLLQQLIPGSSSTNGPSNIRAVALVYHG